MRDPVIDGYWTPYQQSFLADQSSQICVLKARRIGFSEVCVFRRAARACGLQLLPGKKPRIIRPVPQNFVSASLEQSKDLLKRCLRYVEAFEKVAKRPLIKRATTTQAELVSGVPLRAFSSNPETMRGGEGDYMLDEFAAMKRQEKVWAAVSAAAKATLGYPDGFEINVVFTPLGDDNMAYEMARGRMAKSFSLHEVSIHDAIRDGFPIKVKRDGILVDGTIAELREEIGDPDIFAQEYELSFLSASTRYISAEIYDNATYSQEPDGFHNIGSTTEYAGIDVARRKDRTALTLLSRMGDINWHRYTEVNQNMTWDDQEAWVDEHVKGCGRVMVDKTGIGDQFAERMGTRWPGRIEAVDFTQGNKEVLATGLKLALSRGKLRPREDDIELRREVLSMRREITELGNVRYLSPRAGGGHGDRAWSLALAENASGGAAQPTGTGKIHTLKRPPSDPLPRPRSGGWR